MLLEYMFCYTYEKHVICHAHIVSLHIETDTRGGGNNPLIQRDMKKDKYLANAIERVLDNLEYTIVVCEFDETETLCSDTLLNRLYAIRDLMGLCKQDIKKTGAI